MNNIQSLHSHTLLSDGKFTHLEMLNLAEKYGISVLAFTDHDYLPDGKIIDQLKAYKGPVKWLIGIEISSGLPKEMGGGEDGPHMIGLFVDPTSKGIQDYCIKSQQERTNRMKLMVKSFQNLGFDITKEDCFKFTTGATLGQPHIVAALKSKEKNLKLIDEFMEKARKRGETDPQIKAKYDLMMQRGEGQYPYMLFLSSDAIFSGVRVPLQFWMDLDESVSIIRNAGGVATIAHYSYAREKIPLEMVEKLLKEDRLDGMETVYGVEAIDTNLEQIFVEDKQKIRKWLKTYGKIASGGSDAHKEEDLKRFAENEDYSRETVGMVEKILQFSPVDTSWSNLKNQA